MSLRRDDLQLAANQRHQDQRLAAIYPGSIGLCREERGKQMLKSKKSEKGLVSGFKWATGDVFVGKVERNSDRFRRLVDSLFSHLFLCSSLFSRSPRPRGPTINWLNHKRSLGSCWLSSLRLPPVSFGSKMVAAMTTGQAQSREERRAASPRERGRHGAGLCDRTVDPQTFPNNQ